MNDYVKAWQCIGCGKIEAPQTCIGICQDRKVQFVYADEHEQTLAELAAARRKADALEALVRRLAYASPHKLGILLPRDAGAGAHAAALDAKRVSGSRRKTGLTDVSRLSDDAYICLR